MDAHKFVVIRIPCVGYGIISNILCILNFKYNVFNYF